MHSHGNPKREVENNSNAGQPCKIGECNEGVSEDNLDGGRHFKPSFRGDAKHRTRKVEVVVRFDPLSRTSGFIAARCPGMTMMGYRFKLACSAELCAASASLAEIAAVSAGLPQLGASLPSPQARGR